MPKRIAVDDFMVGRAVTEMFLWSAFRVLVLAASTAISGGTVQNIDRIAAITFGAAVIALCVRSKCAHILVFGGAVGLLETASGWELIVRGNIGVFGPVVLVTVIYATFASLISWASHSIADRKWARRAQA